MEGILDGLAHSLGPAGVHHPLKTPLKRPSSRTELPRLEAASPLVRFLQHGNSAGFSLGGPGKRHGDYPLVCVWFVLSCFQPSYRASGHWAVV